MNNKGGTFHHPGGPPLDTYLPIHLHIQMTPFDLFMIFDPIGFYGSARAAPFNTCRFTTINKQTQHLQIF